MSVDLRQRPEAADNIAHLKERGTDSCRAMSAGSFITNRDLRQFRQSFLLSLQIPH